MRNTYRDGTLEASKTFDDITATLESNVRLRRGLKVIANYSPATLPSLDNLTADLDEIIRIAKAYLETPE